MLDRIEVRCREGDEDEHVDVSIAGQIAVFHISRGRDSLTRSVSVEVLSSVLSGLESAAIPPIGDQTAGGAPVGYEVTISAGMRQSVFRWVASTPAGWEPVASAARDIIAIARTFGTTTQ